MLEARVLTLKILLLIHFNHTNNKAKVAKGDIVSFPAKQLVMTAEQIDLPHDPNARGKRKRGPDSDREMAKRAKSTMGKVEANMNEDVDSKVDVGINNAFSNMDSQLLADYVAGRTRKFESDLSSVELEDRYIPGMLGCYLFLEV